MTTEHEVKREVTVTVTTTRPVTVTVNAPQAGEPHMQAGEPSAQPAKLETE